MDIKQNLVSEMAENLIGSEIIRIAGEINDKIKKGEKIHNMTIGDFDPKIFPIPTELLENIIKAYKDGHTNYPAANGILELRKAVANFILETQGLKYTTEEILVSGGARPLIYAIYRTLIDEGDTVIFPVPSWNNNHYCHLSGAKPVFVETSVENNFMPTAEDIKPYLSEATLITLCSPLNPTGTVFKREDLKEICDLVIEENKRRNGETKPLYIMYDQIYWKLTFGETEHFDPISINPELKDYVIYVDGISKAFAATGVRVGWAFGPQNVIDKMKSILGHVGSWAPKAEQVATAKFLNNKEQVNNFLVGFKNSVEDRLQAFHQGFQRLKEKGYPVDSISPQAAIYLTVKIDLKGKTNNTTDYLLNQAGMALVPFYAFGASTESPWFRLSVGTCSMEEIPETFDKLEKALNSIN